MAEPDQKSDDSLSKIVVEFLTNTLPFRFLCVNQSLMKTQEFFFAFLAVLNVYAASNVAEKLTLWAIAGERLCPGSSDRCRHGGGADTPK